MARDHLTLEIAPVAERIPDRRWDSLPAAIESRSMSDSFDRLVAIMDRLRDPGGCPWDREQTAETIAGYLLEEAHEAVDAIARGDAEGLCEELGDLLLQIVFLARIARERGWFDVDAVCDGISAKMIRRHPHVFADRTVEDAGEVVRNWEQIKSAEKSDDGRRSVLDGVPATLPALLKAFRVTEKAAAVGFDWRRGEDVVETLRGEVDELAEAMASSPARVRAEMGDTLFTVANLARHLGVEPETALQGTNARFIARFRAMEKAAGRPLSELSLTELDALWERAKAAQAEQDS